MVDPPKVVTNPVLTGLDVARLDVTNVVTTTLSLHQLHL